MIEPLPLTLIALCDDSLTPRGFRKLLWLVARSEHRAQQAPPISILLQTVSREQRLHTKQSGLDIVAKCIIINNTFLRNFSIENALLKIVAISGEQMNELTHRGIHSFDCVARDPDPRQSAQICQPGCLVLAESCGWCLG